MTNKTVRDMVDKFDSGKRLTKGDCKIILDSIYETASKNFETYGANQFLEFAYDFNCDGYTIGQLYNMLVINAINTVKEYERPLSVSEVKALYGLSFTEDHNAKLSSMASLSTNNKTNLFCEAHKDCKGSICESCYADRQLDYMSSMNKPLTLNYLILNFAKIPHRILPIINRQFFRFESFGDVATETQALNYIALMTSSRINHNCKFGAWTKNPTIWIKAFEKYGKPSNLSFGVSSLFVDQVAQLPQSIAKYTDFIFTVWSDEATAEANGYEINCGARHCMSCLRCYLASETEGITYINELKK